MIPLIFGPTSDSWGSLARMDKMHRMMKQCSFYLRSHRFHVKRKQHLASGRVCMALEGVCTTSAKL